MITPSMTGTSAYDESRCGAAEEFEAAPVKAEGDNQTKNTTENLEALFDKQLNLICGFVFGFLVFWFYSYCIQAK